MANNYCQATAHESVKCSKSDYEALSSALENENEEVSHGFSCEFYNTGDRDEGEFYLFAEEFADPDGFSDKFLILLGRQLKKNNMKYLTVGCASYCDKLRPGEFGGYDFKIGQDGSVVYPKTVWPEGYED